MASYLAVFESDAWHLDREVLARALANDWPEARVQLAPVGSAGGEVRDVTWYYHSKLGDLEGFAHSDGQGIWLEGPIEIVADFVVWYRSLVPFNEEVVFCDEGYTFDGVVLPNAEREEIIVIAG